MWVDTAVGRIEYMLRTCEWVDAAAGDQHVVQSPDCAIHREVFQRVTAHHPSAPFPYRLEMSNSGNLQGTFREQKYLTITSNNARQEPTTNFPNLYEQTGAKERTRNKMSHC
jgi:hypothetical protein